MVVAEAASASATVAQKHEKKHHQTAGIYCAQNAATAAASSLLFSTFFQDGEMEIYTHALALARAHIHQQQILQNALIYSICLSLSAVRHLSPLESIFFSFRHTF